MTSRDALANLVAMAKSRYYCPVEDCEYVLFEDEDTDPLSLRMTIVDERPMRCPKHDKTFFKTECRKKP